VKNLTCNEDYTTHGVINSSLCESIEKAIETNDPSMLNSDTGVAAENNNEPNLNNNENNIYKMTCLSYKDEMNEDQNQNYVPDDVLEMWKVY
jgi:hypothetical protein